MTVRIDMVKLRWQDALMCHEVEDCGRRGAKEHGASRPPTGRREQTPSLDARKGSRGARRAGAPTIEGIWNGGDLALADQVFAPTSINPGGLMPDLVRGPEAIKASVARYLAAFPEFRVTVLEPLAQGQTVAVGWEAHSAASRAPEGDRGGGAPDRLAGMTFGRVVGGRILESWTTWEGSSGVGSSWSTLTADVMPACDRLTG
jgi:hypothetical protein